MWNSTLTLGLIVVAVGPLFLTDGCEEPPPDGTPDTLEHDPIFQVNNPLLEPIPLDAEIDPNSDLYIDKMLSIIGTGGIHMPINNWSTPVFYAEADTPRYDVALTVYGASGGYCGKQWLMDVPIPPWARQDPEGDGHMVVVDRAGGCVYDFWGYNNDPNLPVQNAWWASGLPTASDGIYHHSVGAGNAAGLSRANGAVWPDEIANGYIGHALIFGYAGEGVSSAPPVPPATHTDGPSTDPGALPEGAWLQLDPDVDLDAMELTDAERVVGRALQEFGMVLVNVTGGGVRISGLSGLSASPNAWVGVVPEGDGPHVSLNSLPVEAFRVLALPEPGPTPDGCNDNACAVYQ